MILIKSYISMNSGYGLLLTLVLEDLPLFLFIVIKFSLYSVKQAGHETKKLRTVVRFMETFIF